MKLKDNATRDDETRLRNDLKKSIGGSLALSYRFSSKFRDRQE